MEAENRVQIHLGLPYKAQPADDPRVQAYLERGFRVVHVQRVNDREALITLAPPSPAPATQPG
jgi:hypothetical protein